MSFILWRLLNVRDGCLLIQYFIILRIFYCINVIVNLEFCFRPVSSSKEPVSFSTKLQLRMYWYNSNWRWTSYYKIFSPMWSTYRCHRRWEGSNGKQDICLNLRTCSSALLQKFQSFKLNTHENSNFSQRPPYFRFAKNGNSTFIMDFIM